MTDLLNDILMIEDDIRFNQSFKLPIVYSSETGINYSLINKRNSYIYFIRCGRGKYYVGSSINFLERIKSHLKNPKFNLYTKGYIYILEEYNNIYETELQEYERGYIIWLSCLIGNKCMNISHRLVNDNIRKMYKNKDVVKNCNEKIKCLIGL